MKARVRSEDTKKKDSDRARRWRESHKEILRELDRLKYLRNKEKIKARSKKRSESHRELLNKQQSERRKILSKQKEPERRARLELQKESTRKRRAAYQVQYEKDRAKREPTYKIGRRLRSRLRNACKKAGTKRAARMSELLGCSLDELKSHLESKFLSGMSWDNHGEWHIDHKLPCASFDLSIPEQQRICFHYSNLQPLWGIDNIKKSHHVTVATQETLP